ncbi:MAG: thiamine phosphate synthase [Gammaproteobacteria bacterium]
MRRLYLITNDADCPTERQLERVVTHALAAGVTWVQFRTKAGANTPFPSVAARIRVCEKLKKACDAAGALLFVNDDLALAEYCGTHLHLGQSDTPLTDARSRLPAPILIGVTCHDQLALAQTAVAQGANYVSFGACFPSPTKPHASSTDLGVFQRAKTLGVPTVAIGGITAHNAADVWKAGADVLAVSHAILRADDANTITRVCKQILTAEHG